MRARTNAREMGRRQGKGERERERERDKERERERETEERERDQVKTRAFIAFMQIKKNLHPVGDKNGCVTCYPALAALPNYLENGNECFACNRQVSSCLIKNCNTSHCFYKNESYLAQKKKNTTQSVPCRLIIFVRQTNAGCHSNQFCSLSTSCYYQFPIA